MSATRVARGLEAAVACCTLVLACTANGASPNLSSATDDRIVRFAVLATDSGAGEATSNLLRAIGDGDARFVVHYERATPSAASCADASLERRRDLLDASAKAVVPVPAASQWADCGATDPEDRLQRVDDLLFGADRSLGREPFAWVRQSATPRFRRYRENVRWQVGRVLFATMNLPDNNNDFRMAAGGNAEFDERGLANRAWLERTFRVASERQLRAVVLFVEAAPRFAAPLRAPDLRARERDGYYEWKLALREAVAAFKGHVLLVQGRRASPVGESAEVDRPLRDATGRTMERVVRTAAPDSSDAARWLRVEVDPDEAVVFRVAVERAFDDPSGELYGAPRGK